MFLLLSSCTEDFLNLSNPSALTLPVYFKTEADFQAGVNGIYAGMKGFFNDYPGFGGYCSNLMVGDLHSDISRYLYTPNYRGSVRFENIADFVPEPQTFSDLWGSFYGWIARANQVLDLIDGANFDQTIKDDLKGEALCLRAYSYWWLTRLYGDVVIHLKPVTTVEESYKPLSPAADVIAQVIDDATLASTLLPNKANQEPGRVTSGTVRMILSDVYMWQQNWNDAESQLKTLAGEYFLMPDYADVINPATKNNTESIFEIQYSSVTTTYSSDFLYTMFPQPLSRDTLKALTGISNPVDVSWEGFLIPNPDLITLYEPGDQRFAATIKYVHTMTGIRVPMCIKYLHPHALLSQTDENMPVYRYSEALLFLAEAINEQGGRSAEALSYLNQVRNRAGLANSAALSQSEIRDAIERERMIELAFEGKRWFDLVRTGKAVEVITAYGARVNASPGDYYFLPGQVLAPSAFTNIVTKFQIPTSEKLYNPAIQ